MRMAARVMRVAVLLRRWLAGQLRSRLPDRLPDNLVWVTNDEDPEFAAPEAKRGGTFRTSMQSFPLTLRRVGPDSNGGFAGYLRYNQMSLVAVASEHAPADSVVGVALGVRSGRQDRVLPDRQGCALVRRRAGDGCRLRIHARLHAIEGNRCAVLQRLLHDAGGRHSSVWRPDRRRGRCRPRSLPRN